MEQLEITVRFGLGNARTYSVALGTTIGQVKADATNKAALGYPNNVRALVHRVPQDDSVRVANNDTIELETVGTSKAS